MHLDRHDPEEFIDEIISSIETQTKGDIDWKEQFREAQHQILGLDSSRFDWRLMYIKERKLADKLESEVKALIDALESLLAAESSIRAIGYNAQWMHKDAIALAEETLRRVKGDG